MKKGKHDGGFRLIPKKTPEEWGVEICLWLGAVFGIAFGLWYFKRNPQKVPDNIRYRGRVLGVYMMLGMGGGICTFYALSWIWERIMKRIRRKD